VPDTAYIAVLAITFTITFMITYSLRAVPFAALLAQPQADPLAGGRGEWLERRDVL
jgi:hypothetical protein